MLPERIAAIPRHVPASFEDAAPGHRFQLYFRYWEAGSFATYKNVRKPDVRHLDRNERQRIQKALEAQKQAPLAEVCPLGPSACAQLDALRARQQALLKSIGARGYRRTAVSTAPFATGLGNEHPSENGFAFLTPYGLPYLAGSGVKGVLRRGAEALARDNPLPERAAPAATDEAGAAQWTWLDVWWLFGFEGAAGALWEAGTELGDVFTAQLTALARRDDLRDFIGMAVPDPRERARYLDDTEDRRGQFLQRLVADASFRQSLHTRGALDCWDVMPAPAGNRLCTEIMTPHHGSYYLNGTPPHDAEAPVPVTFLAVPAGSQFDFHLVCHPERLPTCVRSRGSDLLDQAFAHAFDWLGFGAKTAVGYGALETTAAPPSSVDTPTGSLARTPATASATLEHLTTEARWSAARLVFNPGTGEVRAIFEGKTSSALNLNKDPGLRDALGPRLDALKKKKELKNVSVRIEILGKQFRLIGVIATT